jgi:hypothetical protein
MTARQADRRGRGFLRILAAVVAASAGAASAGSPLWRVSEVNTPVQDAQTGLWRNGGAPLASAVAYIYADEDLPAGGTPALLAAVRAGTYAVPSADPVGRSGGILLSPGNILPVTWSSRAYTAGVHAFHVILFNAATPAAAAFVTAVGPVTAGFSQLGNPNAQVPFELAPGAPWHPVAPLPVRITGIALLPSATPPSVTLTWDSPAGVISHCTVYGSPTLSPAVWTPLADIPPPTGSHPLPLTTNRFFKVIGY